MTGAYDDISEPVRVPPSPSVCYVMFVDAVTLDQHQSLSQRLEMMRETEGGAGETVSIWRLVLVNNLPSPDIRKSRAVSWERSHSFSFFLLKFTCHLLLSCGALGPGIKSHEFDAHVNQRPQLSSVLDIRGRTSSTNETAHGLIPQRLNALPFPPDATTLLKPLTLQAVKMLIHRFFPSSKFSLWIDGKDQLLKDPRYVLER